MTDKPHGTDTTKTASEDVETLLGSLQILRAAGSNAGRALRSRPKSPRHPLVPDGTVSNEKLSWSQMGFDPCISHKVVNCPTIVPQPFFLNIEIT
ncbi:hypothetical protein PoB_000306400 [Plakobranchus ocellatus]|uniref:Uncharacterized protein n=1 Tax=Plakobranchus ocellatus TaxID=259542 RepID=A0AAV3Y0U1_9GAST|nr:hypothetical protein PoB_000306400 [Plakobranchus ocellatus]